MAHKGHNSNPVHKPLKLQYQHYLLKSISED